MKETSNRSMLPDGTREKIFLNIREIYALNYDLLRELEEHFKQWY